MLLSLLRSSGLVGSMSPPSTTPALTKGCLVTIKQRGDLRDGTVEDIRSGGSVILVKWNNAYENWPIGTITAHRVTDVMWLGEADAEPSGG